MEAIRMDTIAIGQYIQFLRKQNGMSQKILAERLGVSFQAVSKW
jgi:transcriptional regulator with XRE-family HTH domain